jgi:L-ascorbate metabolism protein UlaG (beta-lactamase superfamily)
MSIFTGSDVSVHMQSQRVEFIDRVLRTHDVYDLLSDESARALKFLPARVLKNLFSHHRMNSHTMRDIFKCGN